MEKFYFEIPSISRKDEAIEYITLRKYTDTDYEFVYDVKKRAYQKYVEECFRRME